MCGSSTGDPCAANVGDADADCSESCNEGADDCTADDPDTSSCDDGLFCTGTETCTAGVCGSSTGDPCSSPEVCFETGNVCRAPWINEFHYENASTDANEFIEVAVPTGFDVNVITVTLYNGADGTVYDTHALSTFTVGDTVNGVTFYSKAIAGIENGAPDGIALDINGTLLEFISYEGSFAGTAGVAMGVTSVDIGVSESATSLATDSLSLTGTGSTSSEFTWAVTATATPGSENTGQTIN